jgi:hypothetical protein
MERSSNPGDGYVINGSGIVMAPDCLAKNGLYTYMNALDHSLVKLSWIKIIGLLGLTFLYFFVPMTTLGLVSLPHWRQNIQGV